MSTRRLYDIVALIARAGVGIVFIAHGWEKIRVGINATSIEFEEMGVPLPDLTAVYATFVELLGGLAIIVGLVLPVSGLLLFLDMAGAFIFVHMGNGLFLVNDSDQVENGFELVLVLGLAALLFAAGGAGGLTVDTMLFARRPARRPAGRSTDVPADLPADLSAGKPPTAAAPARTRDTPAPAPEPSPAPRLASEITGRSTRDVLVASGKKPGEGDETTSTSRPSQAAKGRNKRPGGSPATGPDKDPGKGPDKAGDDS